MTGNAEEVVSIDDGDGDIDVGVDNHRHGNLIRALFINTQHKSRKLRST